MVDVFKKAQQLAVQSYGRHSQKIIQYGTAGFRTNAQELTHVMYRMGLLATLRAKLKKATIGVMITASHNDEPDNGVKLVDPHGEMLESAWEVIATHLVNIEDEEIESSLAQIVADHSIDIESHGEVFVGRDTRPSSPFLAKTVIDGINILGGQSIDYGIVSTPQLHYFVVCQNTARAYGEPNEDGYFTKLASAFKTLRSVSSRNGTYEPCLLLDGANGVGALKTQSLQRYLGDCLNISVFNTGNGKLNFQCGADYVKVQQKPPNNMPLTGDVRAASLDGDADRLVYFYVDSSGTFRLLDGDKIATLVAGYLQQLVRDSGLHLKLGLVQTAYANGSSTRYINETLGVEIACEPTGVKYLHHRALDFDVGIYFEANGHGTVIFSPTATECIRQAAHDSILSKERQSAAKQLLLVMDVINQTVGDALSDLLLVETILHAKGWSISDWDNAYTDLPNRQMKVRVADRNVIQTTDAERKCLQPVGLQNEIDALVAKYNRGRSFVRPSGTEDVVRVYAEAETQKEADQLAHEVAVKVYRYAQGVGAEPVTPNLN